MARRGDDASQWLCFTDQDTGRCYKSRLAAARSAAELNEHTPVTAADVETCSALSAAARHLDKARQEENTLLIYPCCNCQRGNMTQSWIPSGPAERNLHTSEDSGSTTSNTDVLVINLEDGMLPLLVAGAPSLDNVARSTRQDYLDDLRRREAVSAKLETLRLALQMKRGRPLAFAFAFGREANLRTIRDLIRNGCKYSETPVFSCTADLFRHLNAG